MLVRGAAVPHIFAAATCSRANSVKSRGSRPVRSRTVGVGEAITPRLICSNSRTRKSATNGGTPESTIDPRAASGGTSTYSAPSTVAISAYALTFGGLVLLGARLGDVLGRRRTF